MHTRSEEPVDQNSYQGAHGLTFFIKESAKLIFLKKKRKYTMYKSRSPLKRRICCLVAKIKKNIIICPCTVYMLLATTKNTH